MIERILGAMWALSIVSFADCMWTHFAHPPVFIIFVFVALMWELERS